MTYAIFGSECASGILDDRAAIQSRIISENRAKLAHLFVLDASPMSARRLVCHWRRDAYGRLACAWAPDIDPDPIASIRPNLLNLS